MALSLVEWFRSFVRPPRQEVIFPSQWGLFAPSMALSEQERAQEAEHYKLTEYMRELQQGDGEVESIWDGVKFNQRAIFLAKGGYRQSNDYQITNPDYTVFNLAEKGDREKILTIVIELQLMAQASALAKNAGSTSDGIRQRAEYIRENYHLIRKRLVVLTNESATQNSDILHWKEVLNYRLNSIAFYLNEIEDGEKSQTMQVSKSSSVDSFWGLPNPFDKLNYWVYSIRQWLLRQFPWLRPLLVLFALVEIPLMLLTVLSSPTTWSRLLRNKTMKLGYFLTVASISIGALASIGIRLGVIGAISSVAVWVAPVIFAVMLLVNYMNTLGRYAALGSVSNILNANHYRAFHNNPKRMQQLLDALELIGPDLQQQTGFPYLEYRDTLIRYKRTSSDQNTELMPGHIVTILEQTRGAMALLKRPPRSQLRTILFVILLGVVLAAFATLAVFFPLSLPFTLPIIITGSKLFFGALTVAFFAMSTLFITSGLQTAIETRFWNDEFGENSIIQQHRMPDRSKREGGDEELDEKPYRPYQTSLERGSADDISRSLDSKKTDNHSAEFVSHVADTAASANPEVLKKIIEFVQEYTLLKKQGRVADMNNLVGYMAEQCNLTPFELGKVVKQNSQNPLLAEFWQDAVYALSQRSALSGRRSSTGNIKGISMWSKTSPVISPVPQQTPAEELQPDNKSTVTEEEKQVENPWNRWGTRGPVDSYYSEESDSDDEPSTPWQGW